MALPEADPADSRRQPLKLDSRASHVEPAMKMRIVRDQLSDLRIGFVDVLGIAGEGGPTERSDAAAEQRPYVLGHESRNIEGSRHALIERHLTNVVAVVEHRQTHGLEAQHELDVLGHRL